MRVVPRDWDNEKQTDATQVMSAGDTEKTLVAPSGMTQMPAPASADQTQIGGASICSVCQSPVSMLELYCGECGLLLSASPKFEEAKSDANAPAFLVDPATGRRYKLNEGVNTLGRVGTDVLAPEATVSRNHATLTVQGGAVTLEDLGSSNGTKVGNQRLKPHVPTTVMHGTELRFGVWKVTLDIMGAPTIAMTPAAPPPPPRPLSYEEASSTSVALSGMFDPPILDAKPEAAPEPAAPAEIPVPVALANENAVAVLICQEGSSPNIGVVPGVITIGRKATNDVALSKDSYISGKHAEIQHGETGTFLIDIGSTNGTLVNGRKLEFHEPQALFDGDEVQIGRTRFLFKVAGANAPSEREENEENGYEFFSSESDDDA